MSETQVPEVPVSSREIMRSAAFKRGVDDVRAGRAPCYDQFNFSQDDGKFEASYRTNSHWHYERGRQWARIAPRSMPVWIGGKLNPDAITLMQSGDIL
jgi:hypothetical protein